jgi:competence protein ComEA
VAPPVVNINTADAAALDALPGVGPSTAAKIVADREANGPFASPEDLGRVPGIGPKKLEQLKPAICVN